MYLNLLAFESKWVAAFWTNCNFCGVFEDSPKQRMLRVRLEITRTWLTITIYSMMVLEHSEIQIIAGFHSLFFSFLHMEEAPINIEKSAANSVVISSSHPCMVLLHLCALVIYTLRFYLWMHQNWVARLCIGKATHKRMTGPYLYNHRRLWIKTHVSTGNAEWRKEGTNIWDELYILQVFQHAAAHMRSGNMWVPSCHFTHLLLAGIALASSRSPGPIQGSDDYLYSPKCSPSSTNACMALKIFWGRTLVSHDWERTDWLESACGGIPALEFLPRPGSNIGCLLPSDLDDGLSFSGF